MITASLAQIAEVLSGELIGSDIVFHGASIDTRTIGMNNLFIAVEGEHYDAHQFIEEALAKGAVAALVSKPVNTNLSYVLVEDTTKALAKLGEFWLKSCGTKTIGITGSCGKTTVKNILTSIFAQTGKKFLSASRNYNNEYGVPLTLFQLSPHDDYAILELGATKSGDIEYLAKHLDLTASLVTIIESVHLESFKNILTVANTKGEIYSNLNPNGTAVINSSEKFAGLFHELAGDRKVITFGNKTADFYSADIKTSSGGVEFNLFTPEGERRVSLPLLGAHNVFNAVAASALAYAAGIEISYIIAGLNSVRQVEGRLKVEIINGINLINDSYNASLISVKAAIDVLSSFPGKKIVVVGDMLELGSECDKSHKEVGIHAKEMLIDYMLAFGESSMHSVSAMDSKNAFHFSSKQELTDKLTTIITENKGVPLSILFKGSRGMRMEEILQNIKTEMAKEAVC